MDPDPSRQQAYAPRAHARELILSLDWSGTGGASAARMTNVAAEPTRSSTPSLNAKMSVAEQTLGLTQGAAYVAMGMWPTLSLRSFAKVTGPKPEGWLVKAVGFLLVAIGTTLVRGARNEETKSVPTLGIGAAAALGGVAFFYSAKRRISPVYFADASLHLAFVGAWGVVLASRSLSRRRVRVG
jgi:hypothetical protein